MCENFKNAANQVAFNHDDESCIVLPGNVTQVDVVCNDLFFSASDSHKRTFVSEFDDGSQLSVDQNVVQDSAGQYRRDKNRLYGIVFGNFISGLTEVDFNDGHETF